MIQGKHTTQRTAMEKRILGTVIVLTCPSAQPPVELRKMFGQMEVIVDLSGGKQKLSGRAGKTTPGPRKFQYHPLGNLDKVVEPYGMEHAMHQQVMSQQSGKAPYSRNQGYFGQSNFFGQFPKTSTEMEKVI